MRIREPVVAGQFYAAGRSACAAGVAELLDGARSWRRWPDRLVGGLVPHAGWICSGQVAAEVLWALAASSATPGVIVIFGGVHGHRGRQAALFGGGRWVTPVGDLKVDSRLAERILGHTSLIVDDPYAHENEHSIEVQLPLVKHLFPEAKIVPIMVPPVETASEVGDAVARTLKAYQYDALVVGTTDLTHYGPSYGFIPHGIGPEGSQWAKEQNDRRFIDLICEMRADAVVAEALTHHNACSSGAAAATVAAVKTLGATRAELLTHTTSSEVLASKMGSVEHDSVGYAGMVFVS